MAVIDDFKARFTEFTTSDVDTYLPALIDEYPCYYGGDYDNIDCDKIAILHLLAHLLVGRLAEQADSSPSQTVASKSVGSVSESYFTGHLNADNEFFMSTRYGKRYLQLISKNIGALFV